MTYCFLNQFGEIMQNVGYGALAILVLMAMITVHEAGHYFVGKLLGFKINEFAIGMGPAIIKKKKKDGEVFSLRLFPLGGYCAFEGEDDDNASDGAFNTKAPWKRILVLLAGATMNYLLALLVIIISMNVYGQSTLGVAVVRPYKGEDAAYAAQSLQDDDCIISLSRDGRTTEIYMSTDLVTALNHAKKGEVIYAEVIRNGETYKLPIKLRSDVECKNMTEVDKIYVALGFGSAMRVEEGGGLLVQGDYIIKLADDEEYTPDDFVFDAEEFAERVKDRVKNDYVGIWVSRGGAKVKVGKTLDEEWENLDKADAAAVLKYFGAEKIDYGYYTSGEYRKVGFFRSLGRSLGYSVRIGGTIFRTLGELLTGKLGLNAMGGTVTTIITATQVMRLGLVYALEIIAFIGVNLAVFNLLPIPALDGSKIVFCIIEWIRKKPLNRKVEAIIHAVGFVLILAFAVLVDVLRFI